MKTKIHSKLRSLKMHERSTQTRMMRVLGIPVCLGLMTLWSVAQSVNFEWTEVGDAGNPGDTSTPDDCGVVYYAFRIAKHEVTNAQYVTFLNAVDPAGTNLNGLYDTEMTREPTFGGILFDDNNADGTKYAAKPGFERKPVTHMSWFDAARFVNWLQNGQGAGSTETGSYDMSLPTPKRSPGARYVLPNKDEWHKAAYYAPGSGANGNNDYWDYPTQSNGLPTAEAPPGGANSANYDITIFALNDVGAYTMTTSYYGAFDMAGNLWEWNEDEEPNGTKRGIRGGAWDRRTQTLESSFRGFDNPSTEGFRTGFRVALVPPAIVSSPVQIVSITHIRNDVTITWNSEIGRAYRVERSDDLQRWVGLQPTEAEATTSSFTDVGIGAVRSRFYRVVPLP